MEPRKHETRNTKAAEPRQPEHKPKLRIVKLEPRIAPKIATNHNETLVRDPFAKRR
jgi:hypothetical protein